MICCHRGSRAQQLFAQHHGRVVKAVLLLKVRVELDYTAGIRLRPVTKRSGVRHLASPLYALRFLDGVAQQILPPHNLQGGLVGRGQHNWWGHTRLQRLLPAVGA